MGLNLKYTEDDVQSLFNFVKSNPESTFDDWVTFNGSQLTQDERDYFKFVEYSKIIIPFKDKEYEFFLLHWNGVGGGHCFTPFKIFTRKYFKDNCYLLNNGGYNECLLVTTSEDFYTDVEEWNDGNFNHLKELTHKIGDVDILITSTLYLEEEDSDYYRIETDLDRNNQMFWDINYIRFYISDIYKLKFEPVLDLFK